MNFIKNLSFKEKLSLICIIFFVSVSCCGCICVETNATVIGVRTSSELYGIYEAGDVIAENYKANCIFVTLPLSILQIFTLRKKPKIRFLNIVFATICLLCSVCYRNFLDLFQQVTAVMGGLYTYAFKITLFGYLAIILALANVVLQIILYKNYKTSERGVA